MDGNGFGFNTPNQISMYYFPKKLKKNYWILPMHFVKQTTINNISYYKTEIDSNPNSNDTDNPDDPNNQYSIKINITKINITKINITDDINDTDATIDYMKGTSKIARIFSIKDYGINLTSKDLVANHSWDASIKDGILDKSKVLGVNGGNNQYVMDSGQRIRFWFDMHGTMHIEVSLSRKPDSRESVLTTAYTIYNNRFLDTDPFLRNNIFLNNYNFSGSPYTASAGIMSMLMFSEYTLHSNIDDPITQFNSNTDNDSTTDLQLFFKPVNSNNWARYDRDITINTSGCKTWFKHSNIYENSINLGPDSPFPTIHNDTDSLIPIPDEGKIDLNTALDNCRDSEECYGVTCRATNTEDETSNECKLWRKDGIQKNHQSNPGILSNDSNKRDAYYKVCYSTTDTKLKEAGFFGNLEMGEPTPFSTTPLTVISKYTEATKQLISGDEKKVTPFVKITSDIINTHYIQHFGDQLINPDSNNTWHQVLNKNSNYGNMTRDDKLSNILSKISPYINEADKIQIPFYMYTNQQLFRDELARQINLNILNREYLNPAALDTTGITETSKRQNNASTLNNAKGHTKFMTSAFSEEGYGNILDNQQHYNDTIKQISNVIIKDVIYSIDNKDANYKQNDFRENKNFINNIILSIILAISGIILFNAIKK